MGRSIWRHGGRPSTSTRGPSPGSGDARRRRTACFDVALSTAFEEWSTRATRGQEGAATAEATYDLQLEAVKLPEAQDPSAASCCFRAAKGGVVECSFAWMARFRRLACDYEHLPSGLAGPHFLAFACLMLHQLFHLYSRPSHAPGRAVVMSIASRAILPRATSRTLLESRTLS